MSSNLARGEVENLASDLVGFSFEAKAHKVGRKIFDLTARKI